MTKLARTLLFILLVPVCAFAQYEGELGNLELRRLDFPSASIDNLFTPVVNPSLLPIGNAAGFGFAKDWNDKNHWWFANSDGLSYVCEYAKDDATGKSANFHTLATGSELLPAHVLPNLYGGLNYRWKNNKFGRGDFRTAFTYRPHNSTSFAFSLDHPHKQAPAYHAGLALRPFAFIPAVRDYRLELSGDVDYSKEDGDYGFHSPAFGLNTQIVDGLKLGASYNTDTETLMFNFSLSGGKTEAGAYQSDFGTMPYIHFADEAFKPFLGLKKSSWYNLPLKGNIVSYAGPRYSIGNLNLMDSSTPTIDALIAKLKRAKADPSVKGILLKNPSFSSSLALMQELVVACRDFKSEGKKIVTYYDNIGNAGYIFAAAVADQIYLNPLGSVSLVGLSVTSPYVRDMLDAIGVDVYNYRSHRYKSAGNMFSENQMTDSEREVYESMLQSNYDALVAMMQAGRGAKLKASVEETIDAGPYFLAQDALAAGLVDGIIYEDELEKNLKKEHNFTSQISSLDDYREYDWAKPKEQLIAVVYANGNIVMGKGTPGKNIAHASTVKLIRAARKNPAYKGIILRVDSGGGSAQASDIILRELQLAQTENKKPMVVSMAGVAASGGYYIACGADRIIADPTTLTGSIGVIGLGFGTQRLWDKLKVNWSTVKKGANADFGSMFRDRTEEENLRMESMIEAIYDDFVTKVDAGRDNLTKDQVHAIAQGRVWTGEQAKANGLIDDLGGLDTALEHMRELTGIKGQIRLVDATTNPQAIKVQVGTDFGSLPGMQILNSLAGDYLQIYELWRDFHAEEALMLSPLGAEDITF